MNRLTYREIFALWLPLALSGEMMSISGPVISAAVSRLPEATLNLAAYGFIMSIAVLIESPVIMMLSASVALVRSRASYLIVRRFVIHLSLVVTSIGLLVYFTPLYDFLFLRVMGLPQEIAQTAHPALQVLLFWPVSIAWRRFFQGILIWQGRSALIAYGTVCRLLTMATTLIVGLVLQTIPGVLLAGLAEGLSVIVEMFIIAWWTRPLIRERVLPIPNDPPGAAPLNYRRLFRFYLPLAGTDAMRVVARPILTAGIARMPNPTLSLAAWSVAQGLSFLFASFVMAIQEVVVARAGTRENERRLAIFAAGLGVVFSLLSATMVVTPLAHEYFAGLVGVPAPVEALAIPVALIMFAMPLLFAARNVLRGVLIVRRHTDLVQMAMLANLLMVILLLVIGVFWGGAAGAIIAAWAMLGAQIFEIVVLGWLWRPREPVQASELSEPVPVVEEA